MVIWQKMKRFWHPAITGTLLSLIKKLWNCVFIAAHAIIVSFSVLPEVAQTGIIIILIRKAGSLFLAFNVLADAWFLMDPILMKEPLHIRSLKC